MGGWGGGRVGLWESSYLVYLPATIYSTALSTAGRACEVVGALGGMEEQPWWTGRHGRACKGSETRIINAVRQHSGGGGGDDGVAIWRVTAVATSSIAAPPLLCSYLRKPTHHFPSFSPSFLPSSLLLLLPVARAVGANAALIT